MAGAITALSFGAALVAQERPSQAERSSQATQQQSPSERLQQQEEAQQQQQQQQQRQYGARMQQSQQSRTKASELKGKEVKSQSGEELGEVEDIAVNLESGEVSYLLVGAEGGDFKPIPSRAVRVQHQQGEIALTVDIDQQRWEQAPTVQEAEIAQLGQPQRGRQIYQFFGEDYDAQQQQFGAPGQREQQQQEEQQQSQDPQSQLEQLRQQQQEQQEQPGAAAREFGQRSQQPGQQSSSSSSSAQSSQQSRQPGSQASSTQQQQKGQTRLGSKLMEAEVQNQQQQKIGEISDFLISIDKGQLDLVLLEAEEAEGTFAVVPQALQVSGEDQVRLNASQSDFEQAQTLREQEVDQRVRQARMMGSQAQQSPQIFRWEESGGSSIFGAPGRDREKMKEEKEKEKEKEKEQGAESRREYPSPN